MIDQLVKCRRCGSAYCYERHEHSIVGWKCFDCGFETTTQLLANTDYVKSFEESIPELFKTIKFVDEDGFVWYPQVINKTEEGIGMIFPDGTCSEDWKWGFAPAIPVQPEEKERFKGAQFKNSSTIAHFDQDKFSVLLEWMLTQLKTSHE